MHFVTVVVFAVIDHCRNHVVSDISIAMSLNVPVRVKEGTLGVHKKIDIRGGTS